MNSSLRCFSLFALLAIGSSSPSPAQVQDDGSFPVQSNLRAGVAKVDITPTEVVDFLVTGHPRKVNGVRDPLRAAVLVLDDGNTRAAIVTLDTIGAWEDMVRLARAAIEKETGIPAANILIAASHNHSAPGYLENLRWASDLVKKNRHYRQTSRRGAAHRQRRLRRGQHQLRHQSPANHRWSRGSPTQPRRP